MLSFVQGSQAGQSRQDISPTGLNQGWSILSISSAMVPSNLLSYFLVSSLFRMILCSPPKVFSSCSSLALSLLALMKWMENSFILMFCIYLFFQSKLPVEREEKPQKRPDSDSPLAQTDAWRARIPTLLGPPTTSIWASGIVLLTLLTSFQPGSEMQGIPASLTTATTLLSSRALTRSNIFVSLQVFKGMSTPLPFFWRQFMIWVSMYFMSERSMPQSQSILSTVLGQTHSLFLLRTFLARYFRNSTLNLFCSSQVILLRNLRR